MTAKVTNFDNFDSEADYDERTKDAEGSRGIGTCCICDNGNSWCVPEHHSGSFVTLATAHTFAYWYS